LNKSLFLLFTFLITLSSCSVKKIVVKSTVNAMEKSRHVFETEDDLEIAEISLASNVKLLEVMLEQDPENEKLNLFLAETFSLFALAFVEDKMEAHQFSDDEKSEYHQTRAVRLYLRARDYAFKTILEPLQYSTVDEIKLSTLKERLPSLDTKHVRAVFWAAFSWGAAINLNRQDMEAISNLPIVNLMMDYVIKNDETYYFGGAHLFKGMFYGGRPKVLGGNREKAMKHFKRALEISKGNILLNYYYEARTLCIQFQDYKCFKDNLNKIIDAPHDHYKQQRLANSVAKRKAKRLLKLAPEFFLDIPEEDLETDEDDNDEDVNESEDEDSEDDTE